MAGAVISPQNSSRLEVKQFGLEVALVRRSGTTSVRDLINQIESTDDGLARIKRARARLYERLDANQPLTLAGLRRRAGLSQREFAAKCGLAQSHVSRYESAGTAPNIDAAGVMAEALGVTLDEFAKARKATLNLKGSAQDECS